MVSCGLTKYRQKLLVAHKITGYQFENILTFKVFLVATITLFEYLIALIFLQRNFFLGNFVFFAANYYIYRVGFNYRKYIRVEVLTRC